MKKTILLCTTALLAGSLFAADSPKDDVKAAAKKLGDNYSWKGSVENAGGGGNRGFGGGPTDGKTAGGTTWLSMARRDTKTEAVLTTGKGAIKTEDGWQSLADAAKDDGGGGFNPTRFLAMRLQNYKTPSAEAADLADKAKELKKDGDAISGDLTEDGAKGLLSFRPPGGGGDGPQVSGAKGSVKFWVKDGALTKYQFNVQGTVSFGGNDREVNRTTTIEIKDVGTTKVEVPDDAKKKLS
jgi:hypothetical protein